MNDRTRTYNTYILKHALTFRLRERRKRTDGEAVCRKHNTIRVRMSIWPENSYILLYAHYPRLLALARVKGFIQLGG